MGIIDPADKLRQWRYSITELRLLIPGEKTYRFGKERIKSLTMIHAYEQNMFPIFKMEIVLESSIYYKILKVKNNIQFHMRIQKFYITNNWDRTRSLYRDYFNTTFDLILDDSAEDMIANLKQKEKWDDFENTKKNDQDDLFMTDNAIEFFLYKTDCIKGLKNNANQILKNCTVTDAIAYIGSMTGMNNFLLSPPQNRTQYETLIIPPLNCAKALQFIDTYYGIYEKGSLMYFDMDYSYILEYNGTCTAWRNKEVKNTSIIIPKETTEHSTESGSLIKKNNKTVNYIVADYKSLSIRNDSISNDIISSNDVEFIDNYTGDVTTSTSGATTTKSNSVKIEENQTENQWLGATYTAQTSACSVVIDIKLFDYDINALTPNKKYNMIFEDSTLTAKYNGIYQLVYAKHEFIREGLDLLLNTVARFKKTS